MNDGESMEKLKGTIVCEDSNDQIYKFEGSYQLHYHNLSFPLSSENLLLRGSSLRNTDWVIGIVVYAGHQTKIMMNSANAKYKKSKIERTTNREIVLVFLIQVVLCVIGGLFGATWMRINAKSVTYLSFDL